MVESQKQALGGSTDQGKGTRPQGSGTAIAWLALLLALVAIAMSTWVYSVQRNVAAIEPQIQVAVPPDGESQVRLAAELARLKDALARVEQTQDSLRSEMDSKPEVPIAPAAPSADLRQDDWLLAEVSFLIRIANQRLLVERDAQNAIGLLQKADQLLGEHQDIAAFELRRQLASDIAALSMIEPVDVTGVYLRLGALIGQVEKLKQKSPGSRLEGSAAKEPVATKSGPLSFSARVSEFLRRLLNRIGGMVVISRDDEPVRPLPLPEEVYYLRQNLMLKLQQAQLALLERNQQIFDQSIGEASSWIGQYFDMEDAATASLRQQLGELAGLRIELELPQLSQALARVNELVEAGREAGSQPLAEPPSPQTPTEDPQPSP